MTTPIFPNIKVTLDHQASDPTYTLSTMLVALEYNKVSVKEVNLFLDEVLEAVTNADPSTHAMRVMEVSGKWVTLTD